MEFLSGFAPWIVFGAVTAATDWTIGALAGLLATVLLIIRARRAGARADRLVLEYSNAAFFACAAVVALLQPHSPIASWTGPLSLAWIALTAWGSLVARRPFTLGIAKASAPREVWDNPVFHRTNLVITAVWAATFTVAAVLLATLQAVHAGTAATIAVFLLYVIPIAFTRRYPAIVRARYARS
ncbi:hypothetical protein ACWT_5458 [Actinoplanes sp. SE50]|uniref:hypothetical protein n=1 Tax=unclassified Actinoplanes TaxID=2626549 RepID=UPI00023EC843|nr:MULTISPECIES: hypothetical protein [unclassified Actinoplanes]AEV86475.1 hypothetical protein ACPL_5588 [Actinoplanes sp. SE50/110]ATO84873.1 hypothetical protein ACWT_5458 [Actinoplanes sp. SE50]SLM02282.1 uncharacterized protein ACSP50_5521 [Actinoplanes sp. SE50/110]